MNCELNVIYFGHLFVVRVGLLGFCVDRVSGNGLLLDKLRSLIIHVAIGTLKVTYLIIALFGRDRLVARRGPATPIGSVWLEVFVLVDPKHRRILVEDGGLLLITGSQHDEIARF